MSGVEDRAYPEPPPYPSFHTAIGKYEKPIDPWCVSYIFLLDEEDEDDCYQYYWVGEDYKTIANEG